MTAAASAAVAILLAALVAAAPGSGYGDGPGAIQPAAATDGAARAELVVTYTVAAAGAPQTDLEHFAAAAADTLGDPRGWSLGGSIRFDRVPSGGDFTLWLAEPDQLPGFHEICSPEYSCQVGDDVIVNDLRWRVGADPYLDAGGSLGDYRRYVVNHEVGHWLGFGHPGCPEAGAPSPVMAQQSITLDGCEPTAWPLEWEREQVGEWWGVPVLPPGPFVDVPFTHPFHGDIDWVARHGIAAGYADGTFRPTSAVSRQAAAAFLWRLAGEPPPEPTWPTFVDVPADHRFSDAVGYLAHAGATEGYDDGTFRPDRALSRQAAAVFLWRLAGAPGIPDGAPTFTDVPAGHPSETPIRWMAQAAIASGYDDGTFRPSAPVSRQAAAAFIVRYHLNVLDGG